MQKRFFKQLDTKKLKLILLVFFLALLAPTSFLVYQAYDQIKWEAYHQQRQLAEELASRIDNQFISLINKEEERAFAEYSFLNIAGEPTANFLQRSPLSNLAQQSEIPGNLGYFQIDNNGRFTTPLLPDDEKNISNYGIPAKEFNERRSRQRQLLTILSENALVKPERLSRLTSQDYPAATIVAKEPSISSVEEGVSTGLSGRSVVNDDLGEADALRSQPNPAASPKPNQEPKADQFKAQEGFDELARKQAPARQAEETEQPYSLGKVGDLKLEQQYAEQARAKTKEKTRLKQLDKLKKRSGKRKERTALPEQRLIVGATHSDAERRGDDRSRIEIFESEIDPFEFSLLQTGQFVLYRKAWRNDHRYIQGILVESKQFLQNIIRPLFQDTTLAQVSDLSVAYNNDVLTLLTGRQSSRYYSSTTQVKGELLYRTRLSAPFNDVEIIFSAHTLPAGPGGRIITWTAIVLFIILCIGFLLMYRMGARQIALARQQQDFVSAVSHELKTPLTSIRMYGEMLREGWAPDDKKKSYYDFIYYESERLSRLIQNILQLAHMTRNDLNIELTTISVSELIDTIRSKVTSQVERNNFQLNLDCDENLADSKLEIDTDYFSQIIINLVDNAIKFSSDAETKQIDIKCIHAGTDRISFSIRDYGPGIEKSQLKKIFTLFYRTENELTRKTVGTGIGLALVHQLTTAMNGEIDVITQNPGTMFSITFPIYK